MVKKSGSNGNLSYGYFPLRVTLVGQISPSQDGRAVRKVVRADLDALGEILKAG